MARRTRKITRRKTKCPRGLWHVLIDAPLPPGDPDYNAFQDFLRRGEWANNRDEVLAWWVPRYPCTRPETWWGVDAPETRNDGESQAAYLSRHDLLTEAEKTWLAEHPEALEADTELD